MVVIATMRRLALALTGACALGGAVAHADNAGRPMTFFWGSIGTPLGESRAIFGDGDFTLSTPNTLREFLKQSDYSPDTTIYLNSRGGDLAAGMEVGDIIRDAHLNTGVARNQRDESERGAIDPLANTRVYPGYCISACTLAFLGGVSRKVDAGSTYAVHQVAMDCIQKDAARKRFPWVLLAGVNYCPELSEAVAMVQVATGAVVKYVQDKGADPLFLSEMSKADSRSINPLTQAQLDAFRINFTLSEEVWKFDTDPAGGFFLGYEQKDEWRAHTVQFYCDRSSGPRLYMWVVHDTRRSTGRLDPQKILELAQRGVTAQWTLPAPKEDGFPDVRQTTLEPYEIIKAPEVTKYDNVSMTIDVSQRLIETLNTAKTFKLMTTEPEVGGLNPFVLIDINLDHEKIAGILRGCR